MDKESLCKSCGNFIPYYILRQGGTRIGKTEFGHCGKQKARKDFSAVTQCKIWKADTGAGEYRQNIDAALRAAEKNIRHIRLILQMLTKEKSKDK